MLSHVSWIVSIHGTFMNIPPVLPILHFINILLIFTTHTGPKGPYSTHLGWSEMGLLGWLMRGNGMDDDPRAVIFRWWSFNVTDLSQLFDTGFWDRSVAGGVWWGSFIHDPRRVIFFCHRWSKKKEKRGQTLISLHTWESCISLTPSIQLSAVRSDPNGSRRLFGPITNTAARSARSAANIVPSRFGDWRWLRRGEEKSQIASPYKILHSLWLLHS